MKVVAHKSSTRLAIGALLCACFANAQNVVLPSAASVAGETVKLSDILPRHVPNTLREASQTIELGRAPRLGSMRVYEGAQIVEILHAYPEIAKGIVVPDRVVVTRSGYPIPPAAIHHAITKFLNKKEGERELPGSAIRWATNIFATENNPSIAVRDMIRDSNKHQLQFTLGCPTSSICRDFLVYVQDPGNVLAEMVPRKRIAAKARPDAGDGAILIRAGRRVQMLMQGDGMQISFKVVCLENGRAGQTIHVRNRDSRQILQAQVVSGNLVWSRLEL